jgi:hypothetical protein
MTTTTLSRRNTFRLAGAAGASRALAPFAGEPDAAVAAPVTASTIETAPLEDGIVAALESMRRAAGQAQAKGRDDFYDAWQADVMDQQPTIFVAVQLQGQTMAWLLDPSQNEGVLEAFVWHHFDLPEANGEPRHDGPPKCGGAQDVDATL